MQIFYVYNCIEAETFIILKINVDIWIIPTEWTETNFKQSDKSSNNNNNKNNAKTFF